MLTLSFRDILVAIIAAVVFVFGLHSFRNKRKGKFPPANAFTSFENSQTKPQRIVIRPWGLPFLGHIPLLRSNPAKTFMEWKSIYGPIFSVRFGSIPTVVLNDVKSIKEAFNLHEFSGRPFIPAFVQLSNRRGLVFADGPDQVEQRKFTVKTLKEFGVGSTSVEQRMQEEMTVFVSDLKSKIKDLSGKPMKMNKLFRFSLINVLWDSIMGQRYEQNDPTLFRLIGMIERFITTNGSLIAQFFWFFPWISKLGNFFNYNPPVHALQRVYNYTEAEIEKAKKSFVKGQSRHFTEAYFNKVAETTDPHSSFHSSANHQAITTADVFMAAIDTTIITMDWLMIYMAKDLKIQRKLQSEIDSVIGTSDSGRIPCLSDRRKLPYTEAVLNELLRVSAIVPLSVFHRTVEDVKFQGYDIPKDTMIISNLYAIHRDPEIWDEPHELKPERFLDANGQFKKSDNEIGPFGIGKRTCLGEGFARDQLFLLTANFFQQFTVKNSENIPSLEGIFGLAYYPKPFEMIVEERKN